MRARQQTRYKPFCNTTNYEELAAEIYAEIEVFGGKAKRSQEEILTWEPSKGVEKQSVPITRLIRLYHTQAFNASDGKKACSVVVPDDPFLLRWLKLSPTDRIANIFAVFRAIADARHFIQRSYIVGGVNQHALRTEVKHESYTSDWMTCNHRLLFRWLVDDPDRTRNQTLTGIVLEMVSYHGLEKAIEHSLNASWLFFADEEDSTTIHKLLLLVAKLIEFKRITLEYARNKIIEWFDTPFPTRQTKSAEASLAHLLGVYDKPALIGTPVYKLEGITYCRGFKSDGSLCQVCQTKDLYVEGLD
jgi:hypothetical protein